MKPVAERAMVPKLRFPEFLEAGEWAPKTIGDFLTESRIPGSKGDVAKKLTVKLWGNGVFAKNESTKGSVNTQYFRRKAGQFIYSKLDFLNQAFGIIPINLDNFESTVDLPCFDFSEGLNPIFLLEFVKRKDFYEKHGETADGSRKAKRIQIEAFLSFPILSPEPDEQQKIADCLSSIDELVTLEAQKLDTLKAHKKGLMQQLFPAEGETLPKLRFPEFRDAWEWEEKKLGEIGDVLMCKRIFANETNDSNGVPFYKIGTLGGKPDAFISNKLFNEYKSKYNFPRKGELLITCSGTVGKCLSYDGKDAYYQDSNIVWIDNPILKISNELLHYLLANINWGKLNSTTITRIYGDDLRGLSLVFPVSEREQKEIVDFFSSIDELITAQTQKLDTLKAHMKGLMQQLFPSAELQKDLNHG